MLIMEGPKEISWPLWKKILFRFFFIFFTLYMAPWTWLDSIPRVDKLTNWYYDLQDWAVRFFNAKIFHIKDELVPVAGSGDTSWGWAQLCLFFVSWYRRLYHMVNN